jgi:8-oxo-dGTP diphosphatase
MEIPNQRMGTAVIVLKGKKVLLGKRKNAYLSGWYGFPGGRVEEGELIIDCAKRELLEEAGIKVKNLEYVGVVRDQNIGYSFLHFGFIFRLGSEQVKNQEPEKCEAWEWFDLSKIPEKTLVGHKAVLDMVKNPNTPRYREVSSI